MRYIPHTAEEIQEMLKIVGVKSVRELFSSTIPDSFLLEEPLKLPTPLDEGSLMAHLESLANENKQNFSRSFMGGGVYRHTIPSMVKDLIRRSEFLTPYTPYQPEVAQGTLQVIFEFQTMVAEIFGMEVANASLYDGSTALSESLTLALRLQEKRRTLLLPENLHPEYRQVAQTILQNLDASVVAIPYNAQGGVERSVLNDYLNENLAACVIPYPNFFGVVEEVEDIILKVHQAGGLVIFCVTEPLSLGLFRSPGELGADIVCGEGQSLGLHPSFGGPFAGLFATKLQYVRQMPGRLCGMTTDSQGKRGFVLTLSTREQHIRRERATSNICTNQALSATQVAMYLSLLGKEGFKKLARLNWERADYAKQKLVATGKVSLMFPEAFTFNEFVINLPQNGEHVLQELQAKGFEGGISLNRMYPELENRLLVAVTETNTKETIDAFAKAMKEVLQ